MASKFLSEEDQRTAGVLPGAESADTIVVESGDEAPEDQLSFGTVTETNGNGNGHANGHSHDTESDAGAPPSRPRLLLDSTGQVCTSCGSSDMVRAGTCLTCRTCGATSGCG